MKIDNMVTSKKTTSGKCFSGILHRLLCSTSLPTHPSDEQFIESSRYKDLNRPEKAEARAVGTAPGVVARLMGLDSLPDASLLPPKDSGFGQFLRSRSVNFADYLPAFDLTEKGQHRRVKTSVSFREVPSCACNQNGQDFFVVCFEKVNEEKETEMRMRKSADFRQVKQKKMEQRKGHDRNRGKSVMKRSSKFEEEKRRGKSTSPSRKMGSVKSMRKDECERKRADLKDRNLQKSIDSRNESVQLGFKKLKKNRYSDKKQRPLCSSKTKNAVSGSCVQDSELHPQVAKSGNSRRIHPKKQLQQVNNVGRSPDNEAFTTISKDIDKPLKNEENDYYTNMLENICKLTEDYIQGTSWIAIKLLKFDDFEEICVYLGEQIFDSLLYEIVNEQKYLNRELVSYR